LEKGREQISQYRLQAKWIFTAWLCITSQVSLYYGYCIKHCMIAGLKALNDCRVEGTLWLQGWRHFIIAGLKALYDWRVEGTLWLQGWRHLMIAGLKALYDCRVEGTLWLEGWRHFINDLILSFWSLYTIISIIKQQAWYKHIITVL
jgi:ribosome modulation factor